MGEERKGEKNVVNAKQCLVFLFLSPICQRVVSDFTGCPGVEDWPDSLYCVCQALWPLKKIQKLYNFLSHLGRKTHRFRTTCLCSFPFYTCQQQPTFIDLCFDWTIGGKTDGNVLFYMFKEKKLIFKNKKYVLLFCSLSFFLFF